MNVLAELQSWYAAQCNRDWEHERGIEIGTLDNPGWRLTINLEGTTLEHVPFSEASNLEPEVDWFRCWIQDGKFQAAGGPFMLERMLRIFVDWMKSVGSTSEC